MTMKQFKNREGYTGGECTVKELFAEVFGDREALCSMTDGERLKLCLLAYRRARYDKEVALSQFNREKARADRLAQEDMFVKF